MADEGNFAAISADQFGHVIRSSRRSRDVIRGGGGQGNVAVNAGVEANHWDALGLGFLEQRDGSLAVKSSETDTGGFLVEGCLEHFDLLVDHGLGFGTFKSDVDVEFGGGFEGALLHCLPELVLETLRNHGDVGFLSSLRLGGDGGGGGSRGGGAGGKHGDDYQQAQKREQLLRIHFILLN